MLGPEWTMPDSIVVLIPMKLISVVDSIADCVPAEWRLKRSQPYQPHGSSL